MVRSDMIHVANRYRGHGVPFLDLIQEGNIGLMRALTEQYRTVRLPSHIVERQNKTAYGARPAEGYLRSGPQCAGTQRRTRMRGTASVSKDLFGAFAGAASVCDTAALRS